MRWKLRLAPAGDAPRSSCYLAPVPRPRLRTALAFVVLTAALGGADWPGRGRLLINDIGRAETSPARRIELLTQIAASPGPESEAAVLRALGDVDQGVRLAAVELVTRHRFVSARSALLTWIDDPSAEVREAATRALGAIGDPSITSSLARLLGDADVRVRLAAVRAISSVDGPAATIPLLNRLGDVESAVRVAAARALGELGDPRAVLSLLGTLQDPIPEVREAAATALGRLRDRRAVRGLLGLLRDGQLDVRVAAARALGTLGDPEAVIDLAPIALRQERAGDPAARGQLARVAIEAIGRIGGPRASERLVQVFRSAEAEPEVARAAANALRGLGADARVVVGALAAEPIAPRLLPPLVDLLGDVGGEPAAAALIGILERPEGALVTESVLRALGRTGAPRALTMLLTAAAPMRGQGGALRHVREQNGGDARRRRGALAGLREYAERRGGLEREALDPLVEILHASPRESVPEIARLIGRTGNPRAPTVLAPLLVSPYEELRAAAADALASVGVAGVERAVAAALGDRVPEVRRSAADALGRHGGRAALDALVAAWAAPRPIDHADAARALGRIGARVRDRRATNLLTHALPAAGLPLAAALLDGLSYLAQSGDADALRALLDALEREPLAVCAAEALGNALEGAPDTVRAQAVARLRDVSEQANDPDLRATAIWALSHAGPSNEPVLVRALEDGASPVAANAAGALARIYTAGTVPSSAARDALCRALFARHHPALRANALLAIARGRLVCDAERERRMLTEGRSEWVRRSAAEAVSIAVRLERDPMRARTLRTALEECAASDASESVAARCREIAASLPPPSLLPSPPAATDADAGTPPVFADASASATEHTNGTTPSSGVPAGAITSPSSLELDRTAPMTIAPPRTDTLDALIVDEDDQTPTSMSGFALSMADGVVRLGATGPDGWVHERPAPAGIFAIADPDSMALEP